MNGLKLVFSFDDGYVEDLRVAELLEKYGFQGIFFIPTRTELSEDQIRKLAEKHIIGGHTVNHPMDMKELTEEQIQFEIEDNREWLREITGQEVEVFCYPRGRYDERVIAALKRAGYLEARTTAIGWHFGVPEDPYRVPTTAHIFNRREYNGMRWQDYSKMMFDKAMHSARKFGNGHFHLWGHTKIEIERFNWWEDLENLLKYIHENISR